MFGDTNLWWWKSPSTSWTLWQHPLAPLAAALTQGRRILHGPVAFVEHVLHTLRDLRNRPLILYCSAGGVTEAQRKRQVYIKLQITILCVYMIIIQY